MVPEKSQVSIRPEDFVDALPMPIDANFLWKESRFNLFDYVNRAGDVVATTTAARITFANEATGEEMVQQYSVSDPKRFIPSEDGKTLVPMVPGANSLNKSSNFFVLMKHLEQSGGGELLGADISLLDGLVTHNIGVPEPVRSGLVRAEPAEGVRRARTLAVPDKVIKMPGGKKAAKKAGVTAPPDAGVLSTTLGMLTEMVATEGEASKKGLASKAFREKQPAVAKFVYEGLTEAVLAENGYTVDANDVITAIA